MTTTTTGTTAREAHLQTLLAPYAGTTRDRLGSAPTSELRRRLAVARSERGR